MQPWKTTPPWLPIELPEANRRDLHSVVAALDVENALRYKPKASATYCNIFVSDVTGAAGYAIPHWADTHTGEAVEPGSRNSREQRANDMVRWLHNPRHGWTQISRPDAHLIAATGGLVVLGWDSQSARPGHIAIMLPEGTIAQAGAQNFVGGTIAKGFGELPVKFFCSPKKPWPAPQAPDFVKPAEGEE